MLTRHYRDVNGQQLTLTHLTRLQGYVGYRRDANSGHIVHSLVDRWLMEDGSVVQVPIEAWQYCAIDYKDTVTVDRTPHEHA